MEIKDITYRLFRESRDTFSDADIKAINEKAIWYRFTWGTGMGGEGSIDIYTKDLKRYHCDGTPSFDGIETTPGLNWVQRLAEIFPVLFSEDEEQPPEGWTMSKKWHGREYIHEDRKILEDFLASIDKEEGQIEVILYDKTKKEREERAAYEKHFQEIRLTPDEICWKNIDEGHEGCYTLMFKKDEETKEYEGCIFLIDYQKEEFKPGGQMGNAKIDSYNLFYRHFESIEGPLEIAPREKLGFYDEITKTELSPTLSDSILVRWNLEFVRAFKTLEEAKAVVPYWAQIWGRINRENFLKEGTPRDDHKEVLERRLRRAELLLIFAEHHEEILEALKKEITPGNALPDIESELGLKRYEGAIFWRFMKDPQLLCKDSLERAEKQVKEYREMLKKI